MTATREDPPFPPGLGLLCRDVPVCIPAVGVHAHANNAECIHFLRAWHDGRFGNIQDDQCCVCYFE